MTRRILYVLTAVLLLTLPALSQTDAPMQPMPPNCPMPGMGGGQGMMGPGMMGGGMMGPGHMALDQCLIMHIQALGLSDDQMSRIRPIVTDYQKDKITLTSQIQIKEIDLHTMLMADTVDMKKVETQVRDINRLQGDLQLAGIRAFEAGKKMLTPAQIQMLHHMMMGCMGSCPMMGGGMPMPMMGGGMPMPGMPGPGGMAPGPPMAPGPGGAPMTPPAPPAPRY